MNEEPMEFTKMEETIEEFEKLSCTMVPEVENHTKTRPNCRNETKWNCISDWVLNDRGEKVLTTFCYWVMKILIRLNEREKYITLITYFITGISKSWKLYTYDVAKLYS